MYLKTSKKGWVGEDTRILLRISEKLITKLNILRYKNEGLFKVVLYKKKKHKRDKAINLYDPGEQEGRSLFFSPKKTIRVR